MATGKKSIYSVEGSRDKDPWGENYFGRPFHTDKRRTLGIRGGEESRDSEQSQQVTLLLLLSALLSLLTNSTPVYFKSITYPGSLMKQDNDFVFATSLNLHLDIHDTSISTVHSDYSTTWGISVSLNTRSPGQARHWFLRSGCGKGHC